MIFRTLLRTKTSLKRPWLLRRISDGQLNSTPHQLPQIAILRPVLWSAGSIALIYYTAASWEAYLEIESYRALSSDPKSIYKHMSPDRLDALRLSKANTEAQRRDQADISVYSLTSMEAAKDAWKSLSSTEKAAWTAIGINTALYLPSKTIPFVHHATFHLPSANRSWTLLSSTFGHGSPLHLLVNMYVLNNFSRPVSRSYTFQGSAPHATAFYLSSGILATLAYHLNSVVKPMYRVIPCLGASGAIYALLGVFGMSYPDARLGIILLPFSFPAQQALLGLAAFELYGTIFGTRLGLAHVSHLGGLATGVAYVYFDGAKNIWKQLKGKIIVAHQRVEQKRNS